MSPRSEHVIITNWVVAYLHLTIRASNTWSSMHGALCAHTSYLLGPDLLLQDCAHFVKETKTWLWVDVQSNLHAYYYIPVPAVVVVQSTIAGPCWAFNMVTASASCHRLKAHKCCRNCIHKYTDRAHPLASNENPTLMHLSFQPLLHPSTSIPFLAWKTF